MQVLIDTNIVLDVLLNRTNFVLPAVKILKLSEDNVQNAVAESHEYDAIITRNKKDYKNSNYQAKTKYRFQNLFSTNSTIEIWDNGQVYAMYYDSEGNEYTSLVNNEMILALCNMPDSKMYLMKMED